MNFITKFTLKFCKVTFAAFFVFILVFIPKSINSQAHNSFKPFANSEFIDVDNVKLHYRRWEYQPNDSSQWVLLVHGFAGSTYSWNKNVSSLIESGFNVVAVDVAPFGYSDKSNKLNHSVDSRAKLLLNFINTIQPEAEWNLIGHSMGGGIVAAMAIIDPEKINKVILVDPALFGTIKPGRSIAQKVISFPPIELALASIGKLFFVRESRIAKFLESAYGEEPNQEDIFEYYKPLAQKGVTRSIVASFSKANPTVTLSISDLNQQCIAIWGANDTWVPYSEMKKFVDQIPNISTVIIKGTAHNPMETDAKLFNRLVTDFLQLKE